MLEKIILWILVLFLFSSCHAQFDFGFKLGTTYGQHLIYANESKLDEGYEGFGASIGFLVDYHIENHILSSEANLFYVHTIYNTTARFRSLQNSVNFYFLDIPIVYSYKLMDRTKIGGGVDNALLIESGVKLGNQLSGWRYPYYFGLIGQVEYEIFNNLSIVGRYKYLGLFQNDDEAYFFFPLFCLDIKYCF